MSLAALLLPLSMPINILANGLSLPNNMPKLSELVLDKEPQLIAATGTWFAYVTRK